MCGDLVSIYNGSEIAMQSTQVDRSFGREVSSEPPAYGLDDLFKLLRRRRSWIIGSILVSILLGLGYVLLTPRLYRAEAKLQVMKQDPVSGLGDPEQTSASMASDALDFNLAVQTQVDVLKSRRLAMDVIGALGLESTRDYAAKKSILPLAKTQEDQATKDDNAYKLFEKRLGVESISGTRLISVTFQDRDPKRAADVVNRLIAGYLDYNYQTRLSATNNASAALSSQLKTMKQSVEDAQAKASDLQQKAGNYGIEGVDNPVIAKVDQLNNELTTAQANRIARQQILKLVGQQGPEALAGLIGQQGTGANTTSSPIQMLRQQQAEAAANYADLKSRYGSKYPKVMQEQERLDAIQASIDKEDARLKTQALAEYNIAASSEDAAATGLQAQEHIATKLSQNVAQYTVAKHEADAKRDLYEALTKRLEEAGVMASLHAGNLEVLDAAAAPSKPSNPRAILVLAIMVFAGIFLGLILAFAADLWDTSVRDPKRIEDDYNLPILGLIPPIESEIAKTRENMARYSSSGVQWKYQTSASFPDSATAESFRKLRTSVSAAVPHMSKKIIAITSPSENEGKSFTAFNLAVTFAQSGRSVLVIDADLHKKTLSHVLGFDTTEGLDTALSSQEWQKVIQPYAGISGLFVLPAGHCSRAPGDVVSSVEMMKLLQKVSRTFDLVIIDTPSIMPVVDAVALSSLVDSVVLVARYGVTAKQSFRRAVSVLRQNGASILGVVLNGISHESSEYYYYWGKAGSGYLNEGGVILPSLKSLPLQRTVALFLIAGALLLWPNTARCQTTSTPLAGTSASSTPTLIPRANDAHTGSIPVGPGDLLKIAVYDAPELNQEVRVGTDGLINLALIGPIQADKLDPAALAQRIEAQLKSRDLILSPHVTVTIAEYNSQAVTVAGEVTKPGQYPIYSPRDLVEVIALAGGLSKDAGVNISIKHAGDTKTETVFLPQTEADNIMKSNVPVYPGDIVVVPKVGIVYVLGNVTRPGGYTMRDQGKMTVLEAVSEAQGTSKDASMNRGILLRKTGEGTAKIPIKLKEMQHGKIPDMALQAGDVLFISPSGLKTFGTNTEAIAASISGAALYAVY